LFALLPYLGGLRIIQQNKPQKAKYINIPMNTKVASPKMEYGFSISGLIAYKHKYYVINKSTYR
jgi:hypothetical protein